MNPRATGSTARGLASLRELAAKQPDRERCDLCSAVLAERHQHLLDPRSRRLLCACDPCAILFASGGETKYRRVPRDIRRLHSFNLTGQAWNSLGIPIGLAFIYFSSGSRQVFAVYPSPAGPTESELDSEVWNEVVADNPVLARLAPDVEALLINRMNGAQEYFCVPLDECYRLTGLVRKYWRGFSGGDEGWAQINDFFRSLNERSSRYEPAPYA
ncbi:MAG: hypothetical protein JO319_15455 [Acidobacteriaceae bacterium]|nr:hypothetical protein [Acidobacteriaceae bacterium]